MVPKLFVSPSAFLRRAVVSYLGGLSLPRKSVVRLTDRLDMTIDVYRGRKTTMQQQQQPKLFEPLKFDCSYIMVCPPVRGVNPRA